MTPTTTKLDEAQTDAQEQPYFVGGAYHSGDAEIHQRIMERIRSLSPAEFLISVVDAGIYSSDGRLLPPYTDTPIENATREDGGSSTEG